MLYQFLRFDCDNDNDVMGEIVNCEIDYNMEYLQAKSLNAKCFVKKNASINCLESGQQ